MRTWVERGAWWALLLLGLTFPFEQVRQPLRLPGGITVTNVEAVLLLTLFLWGVAVLLRRRAAIPRPFAIAVSLWVGVLFLSAGLAPSHRGEALKFASRMASGVLLGWATYDLATTPGRRYTLARALALAGVGVAILGIAEALGWTPITRWLAQFKEAPTRVGEIVRVSASLIYATITSMVLELTAPLVLAWAILGEGHGRWRRLSQGLLALAAGTIIVAQVLTLTRAGFIALSAAFAFLVLVGRWNRTPALRNAALAGWACLVLTPLILAWQNPVIALRLVSETDRPWYQAAYRAPDRLTVQTGQAVTVEVEVRNVGVRTWVPEGPYPFALGYHLYREDGTPVAYDGPRTPLPRPVPPGESVRLRARLVAPAEPGRYRVQWDMVQEAVTWFSWKGSATATTWLEVQGPAVAQPAVPRSVPPSDVRLTVPAPGRLTLWRTAWRMFRARPLLGVGPDNFRLVYGEYAGVERWDKGIHANSLYLEWLADTGILGSLAFLAVMLALAVHVYRSLRALTDAPRPERVWFPALSAALVAWFVHGFFDYFYEFLSTLVPFWMVTGLVLRGVQREEEPLHARGV